jgi:hypothetical protein
MVAPQRDARHAVKPDQHVSGARLLFTDAEVAARVLNEMRHRAITRVFGVQSREDSFTSLLITMIAIGAVAEGVQGAGAKVREVQSGQSGPSLADALIGGAVVREAVRRISGATSEDAPRLAALIVFALLAHAARPVLAGSLRGVRAQALRVRSALDRYRG